MTRWSVALGVVLSSVLRVAAEEPPLMCFGNEPSWSLAIERPDAVRLTRPDEPAAEYHGTFTRIEALRERVWRGKLSDGGGAELVVFLREADCSDGMSDVTHPVVARVSLPDGRFFAGCCRITSAAPQMQAPGVAPGAASATIEGPVWRLTRLRGQGDTALAGLADAVTLRFVAGRLQGFGGCNQLVGTYTTHGDRVTFGALAGTMMACPEPVMMVETAFKDALAGTLHFSVGQDRLVLAAESDSDPKLVFEATPPPQLEGVTWEVTGFNNGRHAVVSPLIGTTLTVSFQDGTVVGNAGCNSFRAKYTRDGNRLTIGPAAATRKICNGKGVMEQEREFLAAIESATTWAIDRGMLDLHRADGERVLFAGKGVK